MQYGANESNPLASDSALRTRPKARKFLSHWVSRPKIDQCEDVK